MSAAPNTEALGQGLELMRPTETPPAVPRLETQVRAAAREHIQEGRGQAALEALQNPAEQLTRAEVRDNLANVYQYDLLTGNSSTAENARREAALRAADTAMALAEAGQYSQMNAADRGNFDTHIRPQLYNFLRGNPAIQAIRPGFDPATRPADRDMVNQWLENGQLGQFVRGRMQEVLNDMQLNYDDYRTKLEEQKQIQDRIAEIKNELGTTGPPPTGVHERIAALKVEKDSLVRPERQPNGSLRTGTGGSEGRRRATLENQIAADRNGLPPLEAIRGALQGNIENFRTNPGTNPPTYQIPADPITGGARNFARADVTGILTEYQQAVDTRQRRIQERQEQIKTIDDREEKVKAELDQEEQKLRSLESELTQKTGEKNRKNTEVKRSLSELRTAQDRITRKLQNVTADAIMNHWVESSRTAEERKPEVLRTQTEQAKKIANEQLMKIVYRDGKIQKHVLKGVIKMMKKAPIGEGQDVVGRVVLQRMMRRAPIGGGSVLNGIRQASPDMQPILEEILNDPDQLSDFSKDLTSKMLTLAQYKTPGKLKRMFKEDDMAMRLLQDDVLPSMIEQAKNDDSLRSRLEETIGAKLTDSNWRRKLKDNKWKVLGLLAAVGIGGVAVALGPTAAAGWATSAAGTVGINF